MSTRVGHPGSYTVCTLEVKVRFVGFLSFGDFLFFGFPWRFRSFGNVSRLL